jgi:uncharacterized membrane protein
MAGPIRIIGVVTEEVTSPKGDGTRGSGLYTVPFKLSAEPSRRWAEALVSSWNRPPQFSTMHRPGIARVSGDRIILDGTTMEEVEKYHLKTLKLAVEVANDAEAKAAEKDRRQADEEKAREKNHRQDVEEAARRLDFDDQ